MSRPSARSCLAMRPYTSAISAPYASFPPVMHRFSTDLILSATDLAAFSGCTQRTWLDHARAHRLIERETYEDKHLELLQQRGIEHEDAYLRRLQDHGKRVKRFGPLDKEEYGNADAYRRRHEETLAAMREGWDVIYQGTLFDRRWLGLVDFLLRVDRPDHDPSALGAWFYEVEDAKLTRHAKASAVLQTCVYSEMLAEAQVCGRSGSICTWAEAPHGWPRSAWRTSTSGPSGRGASIAGRPPGIPLRALPAGQHPLPHPDPEDPSEVVEVDAL